MVSHSQSIERSRWNWTVCLGIGVVLLATAALPAGAGRRPDGAMLASTAAPRATPPAYPPADSPAAPFIRVMPNRRPAPSFSPGTVGEASKPADLPELLHAIPAADIIRASAAPRPYSAAGSSAVAAPAIPGGRVVWMEVTAYCGCKKCCGPNACGITASGHPITFNHAHFIAADTAVLPFFTRVIIPGYANDKPVPVIDRGSAIKGDHIDVFFPEHQTAVDWGKRWIAVTVLP